MGQTCSSDDSVTTPDEASPSGIQTLITLVRDGNNDQKLKAVRALGAHTFRVANKLKIADGGGIPPLVALIQDGDDSQKDAAAFALWNLSMQADIQRVIARAGGIPELISLLYDGSESQKEYAARTLWNLSFEVDSQHEIARAGGISALTALLRGGNEVQRLSAALALRKLLIHSDTDIPMDSIGGVNTLVEMVFDGDAVEKEIGAGALWKLSHNGDNCSAIMESGGILALVTLASEGNSAQKEVAVRTLLGLSTAICSHDIIASAGGIPVLVSLLLDGIHVLRELSAGVLGNFAANPDFQAEIATADGISALVAMMRDGNAVHKEKAATVLWNLSRNAKNKISIAAMGGIQVLVDLVRGDNDAQKEIGAAGLWNLSANEYNKAAIEAAGGIPPIVELVRSGNDAQKEKAAAILWNLAFSNAVNQKRIVSEGAIESLVNLALHGTETQQENAAGVLGLVATFLDKETKIHIATQGGVNVLLNFIEKPKNSAWVDEGLVALMGLSGAGRIVRITMKEANAAARLSRLLDTGKKMTVELANELLEWLGCSVAELSAQCEAMGESEPLCRHVLTRLQTFLEQSDEYDIFRPIRNKFSALLQMNRGKSMAVRLVSAHSVADSLAGLHREIDNSCFDGQYNLWIPQWESDRRNMNQRLFGYEIALLDRDLESIDSQAEALTMLLHELKTNTRFYTLDELDHLQLVLGHIQSSWQRQMPALQNWFIAPHDIELVGEFFAKGAFAKIYHGRFMNADVVVKCVDINSARDREDFLREVSVWYEASHHPNIVSLYGACHVGSPCLIVCNEMTGGTLPTYLYRQRMDGHCNPWKARLDVAHGLQYIHGQGIVHADLKGNNILMDRNGAKLTDFGMSFFQAAGQPTFPRLGALRWRAPEFIAQGTASFKADIYSLGMCVVEAVTGRCPWGIVIPDTAVKHHLLKKNFIVQPKELSEAAWNLVCAMCDFDPSRRMELGEVEKRVRAFAEMEA